MLDKLKAAMGRASQKEPVKYALLKEAAAKEGMSLEDYMVSLSEQRKEQPVSAPKEPEAQTNEFTKEVIAEIAALRTEIAALKTSQPQPIQTPQPQQTGLGEQIREVSSIITALKELFPQKSITDAIQELKALEDFRGEFSGSADPEDMGDLALKELLKNLPAILNRGHQNSGEVAPLAPPGNAAQNSGTSIVPKTPERENMNKDQLVKEIVAKIKENQNFVAAIKNGFVSLEQMKGIVEKEITQMGFTADLMPAGVIEQAYNEIKGADNNEGSKPQEDEKNNLPPAAKDAEKEQPGAAGEGKAE